MLTTVDVRDLYARCGGGFVEGVNAVGERWAVQVAADHPVHTWDLARALGTEATLDENAVTAVLDWFDGVETLYRAAGVIGPRVDVAPGAGPQAQLLGRFGRQP